MKTRFITNLDANQVNFGLRRVLPALANLGEVVPVADGFSSHVFSVGGNVILRVAKNNEAETRQAREYKILPSLQNHLSLQIPQPRWYLKPSNYFPFGAVAYPKIRGKPFDLALTNQVNLEQIAASLATFLLELHSLEPPVLPNKRDNEPTLLWSRVKSTLQANLHKASYILAEAWWYSFAKRSSLSNRSYTKLVHGDLWGENIILDDSLNHVVGIVDFEMLAVGDVAQDFAPQVYISQNFATMVSDKFQVLGGQLGEDFGQRVYDWSILRELRGLAYALIYPESNELEESLQKVARFWSDAP